MRIGDSGSSASDPGDDVPELTGHFADWLAQDRSVGPHLTMERIRRAPVDGAMSGQVLEWVSLTLSSGFSAAGLIYSHLGFRASLPPGRRHAARMVIEHNGVRLVIDDGTEEDVARLVRLLDGLGDSDGDTGTDGEAAAGDGNGGGT
ncbi:effector-associated constant component EACC1 [Streptomyces albus]|uniref:effector-associated constant component EACC1 n=1 Tax=Streptomyces albus TaxID=1888 RepID=UPI0033F2B979